MRATVLSLATDHQMTSSNRAHIDRRRSSPGSRASVAVQLPLLFVLFGCSAPVPKSATASKSEAAPVFFHVDPVTAGVLKVNSIHR